MIDIHSNWPAAEETTPVYIMAKTILKGRAMETASKRIAQNVEDDLKAAGFAIVPTSTEDNAR